MRVEGGCCARGHDARRLSPERDASNSRTNRPTDDQQALISQRYLLRRLLLCCWVLLSRSRLLPWPEWPPCVCYCLPTLPGDPHLARCRCRLLRRPPRPLSWLLAGCTDPPPRPSTDPPSSAPLPPPDLLPLLLPITGLQTARPRPRPRHLIFGTRSTRRPRPVRR